METRVHYGTVPTASHSIEGNTICKLLMNRTAKTLLWGYILPLKKQLSTTEAFGLGAKRHGSSSDYARSVYVSANHCSTPHGVIHTFAVGVK